MLLKLRILIFSTGLTILLLSLTAKANVCGTDYQTFNPTSSGLDFVSVHSSETLNPCYINFGTFLNYSVNTLTYTRNYTDISGNKYLAGDKPNDQIWGLDLNMGIGLSKVWDIGFSVPFVVKQSLANGALSSNYKSEGATEVRAATKYRLRGDEQGGLALVASINQNLIKNNPFSGDKSKPTFNLELVTDYTIGKWAAGLNIGHRWRNPGEQIPDVPFEPLGNQLIYSAATSYYFEDMETKLILEFFGGHFLSENNASSQRSPDSFEWQLGLKHDISNSLALHFGGGTQLFSALGSPEYRIYAGINWNIGPFCEKPTILEKPRPLPKEKQYTQLLRYNASILFAFDSSDLRSKDLPEVNKYFDNTDLTKISKIIVEGHTDSRGDALYNINLSQRRALALKNYLLVRYSSIKPEIIETLGRGEEMPVADNANFQGRQQNRRVDFIITVNNN